MSSSKQLFLSMLEELLKQSCSWRRITKWKCEILENVTNESQNLKDNFFTLAFRIDSFIFVLIFCPGNIYRAPPKPPKPCFMRVIVIYFKLLQYYQCAGVWVPADFSLNPTTCSQEYTLWEQLVSCPAWTQQRGSFLCLLPHRSRWHRWFALWQAIKNGYSLLTLVTHELSWWMREMGS